LEEVEEKLREAFGDRAFNALRWHISQLLGMDMVEAFEKGPGKLREALEEFFGSKHAVEIVFKIAGVGRPPTHRMGGRG
jgi:Mg/Co/Ni transporter MgtE